VLGSLPNGPGPPPPQSGGDDRLWRLLSGVLLVALLGVMLATFLDYGITWDEGMHNRYGRRVVRWYTTLGADAAALDPNGIYFYGGLFELAAYAAEKVSPLGVYETRHLVNVLVAFIAFIAAWGMGTELGGPVAGFLSPLFLALTPAFYGHAFANPKDIPLASLFALAAWVALRASERLPELGWKEAVGTGLAIGLAAGVRVVGIVLFAATAVLWLGCLWLGKEEARGGEQRSGWRDVQHTVTGLLISIVVGWAVMVSVWPWALLDPITNPFRSFLKFSRFRETLTVLFDGQLLTSGDVSRYYIPKLFILTLPEFYFLAFLLGGLSIIAWLRARGWKRPSLRSFKILWVSAIAFLPIAWVVLRHTPFYDGHRHLLFVVPFMAVLAGTAAAAYVRGRAARPARAVAALGLGASCLLTVIDMIQLHPYQYVYFNRLFAGGLAGAVNRYETDYWCASYKEGLDWVVRHYARPGRQGRVRVAGYAYPGHVGLWRYLGQTEEGRRGFEVVSLGDDPHVVLATTALRDQEQTPGRVVHVVERQGAPLLYIFEVRAPE
jgi:hypothetical protein